MSNAAAERKARRVDKLLDPSARTTAQLSNLPPANREDYMKSCVILDLGNLVRCVLDSGVHPDMRVGEGPPPQAVSTAPQIGTARALKALLEK